MKDRYHPPYAQLELYADLDPLVYDQLKRATDAIFITPVFENIFYALHAFSESELDRKYAMRASKLGIPEAGRHRWVRSQGINGLGIARLRTALATIERGVEQLSSNTADTTRLNKQVRSPEFRASLEQYIIPDIRTRLLESTGTPGEVSILAAELLEPSSWIVDIGDVFKEIGVLVKELLGLREDPARGNQPDPTTGVPRWKVIATKIVRKLVKVIIGHPCVVNIPIPIIGSIVCLITETIWGWVWQLLEVEIWSWCRDAKPENPS